MEIDTSTTKLTQDEKVTCYATCKGKVVGEASIIFDEKPDGRLAGLVEDVAVDENYRKQGIGSSLVGRLVEIARSRGCYKVCFVCRGHNVHFYEENGFSLENQFSMRMNLI